MSCARAEIGRKRELERPLQEVRRGVVDVERAKELIADALARRARIHTLIVALGHRGERVPLKERCAEALAGPLPRNADPSERRIRGEPELAMRAFESFAQRRSRAIKGCRLIRLDGNPGARPGAFLHAAGRMQIGGGTV